MSFLAGLNDAQKRAVDHHEGPLLVVAGAGSGKTRALTHRIAHLIGEHGTDPAQILAVTFTNKAAREMKERVGSMLGQPAEGMPWLGTFHSVCVKLLRRHAELISGEPGVGPDEVIDEVEGVLAIVGVPHHSVVEKEFAKFVSAKASLKLNFWSTR